MDEHRPDESRSEIGEPPLAKFNRFEKVVVANSRMGEEFAGRQGTVIWQGCPWFNRRSGKWSESGYCISFTDLDSYCAFKESDLQGTGEFDPEEPHRGKRFEISFDTILEDDDSIVEGCYRVPGELWQGFLFIKEKREGEFVPELRHRFSEWWSGLTGIEFDVPREVVLDRRYLFRAFSTVFGTEDWVEVLGPDSGIMKQAPGPPSKR